MRGSNLKRAKLRRLRMQTVSAIMDEFKDPDVARRLLSHWPSHQVTYYLGLYFLWN